MTGTRILRSAGRRGSMAAVMAAGVVVSLTGAGYGQSGVGNGAAPAARPVRVAVRPERATLQRMLRPVTIELSEQRLEDVMQFITEVTGAELEPVWATDNEVGLDPEALITLRATNLPALTFLERVLTKAGGEYGESTWQMTPYGTMEIGPKERLNRQRRVEVYDINDMLLEIPDHPDAPELDLQGILQQGGGGGGSGQSPFEDTDEDEDDDRRTRQEKADDILELITSLVEPDQWVESGGSGGSIRYHQGTLIVNAPDYMHRQLNGYPYWPSRTATVVEGRRYVSLGVDAGNAQVDDIKARPITPPPR